MNTAHTSVRWPLDIEIESEYDPSEISRDRVIRMAHKALAQLALNQTVDVDYERIDGSWLKLTYRLKVASTNS